MTAALDTAVDVRIGPLRRRHLRSVVRIEQQASPRPWGLGLFLSELRLRDTRRYVVAHDASGVLGFAGLMLAGEDGHITNIAVDEAHRRRRVATRLLLVLAREAVACGAVQMSLEVRTSNTSAQELYRRFGFVPAGVRRNYYAAVGEDALVMWAHDVDHPDFAARLDELEAALPSPTIEEGVR